MTIAAGHPDLSFVDTVPADRDELVGLLATGPFPDALRAAIKTSRLSLDRIQHRLGLRGITISVATLSYWQSGRRRPERPPWMLRGRRASRHRRGPAARCR